MAAGAVAYFFFSKKTSTPDTTAISENIINPSLYQQAAANGLVIKGYNPPAGYSGPEGGPYKWAGDGNPPNDVWVTKGTPYY